MNNHNHNIRKFSESTRGISRWKLISAAGLVALLAGIVWAWSAKTNAAAANEDAGRNKVTETIHLDTFVVNLGDSSRDCFLRIGLELGVDRAVRKSGGDKSELPNARIRDTILDLLASSNPDALLLPNGRGKLKQALLEALQGRLPQLGVREIYITDFLIQR